MSDVYYYATLITITDCILKTCETAVVTSHLISVKKIEKKIICITTEQKLKLKKQ